MYTFEDREKKWGRVLLKILMHNVGQSDHWRKGATRLAEYVVSKYNIDSVLQGRLNADFIAWAKKFLKSALQRKVLVWGGKSKNFMQINQSARQIYLKYRERRPTDEDSELYEIGKELQEIDDNEVLPDEKEVLPSLQTSTMPSVPSALLGLYKGEFRICSDSEWDPTTPPGSKLIEKLLSGWDEWASYYRNDTAFVRALETLLPVHQNFYILAQDFLFVLMFFIPHAKRKSELEFFLPDINRTMEEEGTGLWERKYIRSENPRLGLSAMLVDKEDCIEFQEYSDILRSQPSRMLLAMAGVHQVESLDPLDRQSERFDAFPIEDVDSGEKAWLLSGWQLLSPRDSVFKRALGDTWLREAETLFSSELVSVIEFRKRWVALLENLLEVCSIQEIIERVSQIEELSWVLWIYEGNEEEKNKMIQYVLLPLFIWQLYSHERLLTASSSVVTKAEAFSF